MILCLIYDSVEEKNVPKSEKYITQILGELKVKSATIDKNDDLTVELRFIKLKGLKKSIIKLINEKEIDKTTIKIDIELTPIDKIIVDNKGNLELFINDTGKYNDWNMKKIVYWLWDKKAINSMKIKIESKETDGYGNNFR